MPDNGTLASSLFQRLSSDENVADDPFRFVSDLCLLVNRVGSTGDSHEILLRAYEKKQLFGEHGAVLDGLIRSVGLFPYLDPDSLSLADFIAYEVHRPDQMGASIVFHRAQAHVYQLLMAGENIALSAPTSFGKSLVIDAVIASRKFKNIVIVVPTLALIDETRRRLVERFRSIFKVITHPSQAREERNIFVLTQERVLEEGDWSFVDFFVIDEFYKLSPGREDGQRSAMLNQAFYLLAKSNAQFYMLGPSISGITEQNHLNIELRFIHEPGYHTVATEIHRMRFGEDEFETLVELCQDFDTPTIIFCRSPNRASEVARRLVSAGIGADVDTEVEMCKWIDNNFHSEWHFRQALANGIGVHHGRIPRSLGQYVVRSFNSGSLRFLVCTSTLIEGVNTRARNIVVFDNAINQEQIDLFTFNNIKGRSGRMFQHFVGHVYVFHDDPQTELPFVDVPVFSQSSDSADSLIVQFDEEDLTEESRERREEFQNQTDLSFAIIQENRGVDPSSQIDAARRIASESSSFKQGLAWNGIPTYQQLRQLSDLMWDHFDGRSLGRGSVLSPSQLTYLIWNLRDRLTTRQLILNQINNPQFPTEPDIATTRVLDFIRLWATIHFPRLLRTLGNIQRDVLSRESLPTGNYDFFASQVESLFLNPAIVAIDEFGIPIEVGRKLAAAFSSDRDLDAAIAVLNNLDLQSTQLSEFERSLVEDAREYL